MRRIKLREWRDGYFIIFGNVHDDPTRFIIGHEVNSAYVTEWTGLNDKNGKEIWEGDIVNIKHPEDRCGDFKNTNGEVFYSKIEGCWYHGNKSGRPPKRMWEYCEVIGNIYENKELLNGTNTG